MNFPCFVDCIMELIEFGTFQKVKTSLNQTLQQIKENKYKVVKDDYFNITQQTQQKRI